jgi:NAD(P)-dependent dehydrogenase (short-subunit alcohol dehydrogenase family)
MEQLAGKVAVVTGAGSHVMVADIDAAAARETAAQLAGTGVEAVTAECDVTDREAVEALASKAWAHFGHVDIAVNNAGVFPPVRRTISIDERDARWVLEVNLMGAWYGCSAFGRRFTEQGTPAHILNTGSENSLGVAHAGAASWRRSSTRSSRAAAATRSRDLTSASARRSPRCTGSASRAARSRSCGHSRYLACFRVGSHRDGATGTKPYARNNARVRVVVRES